MSATSHLDQAAPRASLQLTPRRIAVARALVALVWAAALALAIGGNVPSTATALPATAALLLASYPLIDVVASLFGSTIADSRLLRANAVVSALAAAWIAVAAFGSDAGATLIAFGAWAAVSGAIQLGIAARRRWAQGRRLPLVVSGVLSTVAGISFVAAAGDESAHLGVLSGYMALGALLYLISALPKAST